MSSFLSSNESALWIQSIVLLSLFSFNESLNGDWDLVYPPWTDTGATSASPPRVTVPLMYEGFTSDNCGLTEYMSVRIATSHINKRDSTFCPAIASLNNSFEIAYVLEDVGNRTSFIDQRFFNKVMHRFNPKLAKVILPVVHAKLLQPTCLIYPFLNMTDTPQLTWAAAGVLPRSSPMQFPYLFRAVGTVAHDMREVFEFLNFIGWSGYLIAYSALHGSLYEKQADSLQSLSPPTVVLESLKSGWQSRKLSPKFNRHVVVLCAPSTFSLEFFKVVNSRGMFSQTGRVWIRVDVRWDVYQQGADAVKLQQYVGLITATQLRWDLSMSAVRQAFINKWEQRMPHTNITEFQRLPADWRPSKYGCDDVTSWAYDTMVALALVADEISNSGLDPAKASSTEWLSQLKQLFSGSKMSSFDCLSGKVDLTTDDNGNPTRNTSIGFYNTHGGSNVPQLVAVSLKNSIQIEWQNGTTVMWPDGLRGDITDSSGPSHIPTGDAPLCVMGSASSAGAACTKCIEGKYGVRSKPSSPQLHRGPKSECRDCAEGDYQNTSGQTMCMQCQSGKFSNRSAASYCATCSPGNFSRQGAIECTRCPAGRFQNETGRSVCRPCPNGEFSNVSGASACSPCPAGTFSNKNMNTVVRFMCTKCENGTYNPLVRQSRCLGCPKGGGCASLSMSQGATSFTANKYYYLMAYPTKKMFEDRLLGNGLSDRGFPHVGPYHCPVPTACLGNKICRAGHEGPFCACCSKGYLRAFPWKLCGPCPPRVRNICFVVGLWMTMLISMILLDRINHINVGNLRAVALIVLKIFSNFFIQFSVVASTTELHTLLSSLLSKNILWKGLLLPVMTCLGLGAALENPGLHVISLPCLLDSLGISLNFVYFNIVAAWITVPVVLLCSVLAILLFIAVVCISRSALVSCSTCCDLIQAVSIMILYVLHPMVTSLALSIFNCEHYDTNRLHWDTHRLLLDTRIKCTDPEYQFWKASAYCCLVTWSLGIPILMWWILWRLARTCSLNSSDALRKYGFLYQGFEADQYYYEVVFMLRRVVYLAAAHHDWISKNCRIVLLLVLNLFFFIFHLSSRPYDDRAYARLDALDTWSYYTLVLCLLARLFQMMSEDMEGSFYHGPNGVESKPLCLSDYQACDTDHVPGFTKIIYFPALAAFFVFLSEGIYLLVRSGLWPLEDVALLPAKWAKRMDGRLHITLVPSSRKSLQDKDIIPTIPHVVPQDHYAVLGHMTPTAAKLLEGFGVGHSKVLKGKERAFFKTVFCQAIELVTKHHEFCLGDAPELISLPLLLLQLERLFVASTAVALANRIRYGALYRQRDTWGKYFLGIGQDIFRQVELMVQSPVEHNNDELVGKGKVIRDEARRGQSITYLDPDTLVDRERDLLMRPVSVEELQVAMMMLEPLMLSKAEGTEHSDILQLVVEKHGGLLDLVADVKWLFSPEGFERMRMLRSTEQSEPEVKANDRHSVLGKRSVENNGCDVIVDDSECPGLTGTSGVIDKHRRLARPLTPTDIGLLRYGPLRECALVQL